MPAVSAIIILFTFITATLAAPTLRPRQSNTGGIEVSPDNIPVHGSELCVLPENDVASNGTPVQLGSCFSVANPDWTFTSGSFQFSGNQCLDVVNGVNTDGTRLQTWECTGGPNQQFVLNGQKIQWAGTNKCLDVTNGVFSEGTPLQIWDCNGDANQLFEFPSFF